MPKITNNNPEYFSVQWTFTSTCNFDCWYCEDIYHDGKYRWPNLEKSLSFFEKLSSQHKSVFLNLSGGEPTLWPDLINFVKRKPANLHVDITSNGSRSLSWWRKTSKYLDSVCISFHPDTADANHTTEVLKILTENQVKYIHLWLLGSKESIEKCYYLYDKVIDLKLPIIAAPKAIYNMGLKNIQNIIDDNNDNERVKNFLKRPKIKQSIKNMSDIKATEAYLDGELMDIPSIVTNKENVYKDWYCTIGLKRLYILFDGDIYKGACRVGGKIGNINDDELVLPDSPQLCNKRFCTCIEELRLEKWKD